MKLSIVTTLFHSEKFISEFTFRLIAAIPSEFSDFELIFVNDGSPDFSSEKVLELQQTIPQIILIEFSRNFGHHNAIIAGLNQSQGDYTFIIDADLEEDPESIIPLWSKIIESGYKIECCYGIQDKRKGNLNERISGTLFYKFVRLISEISYPANTLTARIISKRYLKSIIEFRERSVDLWGLFSLNGFIQEPVTLTKKSKGSSTYSFSKKLQMSFDIITSLTSKPLVSIFYIGLFLFLLSLLFVICVIFKYFNEDMSDAIGWASIIASVWLFGSFLILIVGIVSIYISRIYIEVKGRPKYIIKEIYLSNKQK
ncbi:MAG TPA: glycosyltransferase family 2 protein [Oligoflexia bacterium]|nr:glycosyltransferase family 2 protein [Oligoflexia bacterium]HMP47821.1 glycosyltransferase family 2 protein [Oligoflexia bacterium]